MFYSIYYKLHVENFVINFILFGWKWKGYRQSGWLCTRWGEIAQSLNLKYLYKRHCKSCELLWAFKGYPII